MFSNMPAATQVDVKLFNSETKVHFETCDNGIGFDTSTVKPTSLGMRIMRERAEAIGASFQVSSQPGSGTCVEVTWNSKSKCEIKSFVDPLAMQAENQGASMTIKILLVDDHAVVRSGLSKFLMVNKDLKLVGEASDGAEAVQMVSLHKPDIVLMDLMMPGMDGISATREIHQRYPGVKVIALTSFAEQNMIQGALQAGAVGYLQKNVTATELGNAIRSACAGHMILSPEATQVLAQSIAQPQIPGEQLTEREREVLKCMVEGLNNNAIAEKLVVSLGTVKFHISNIFHKLGVNSRVEAVKAAIEQKLV